MLFELNLTVLLEPPIHTLNAWGRHRSVKVGSLIPALAMCVLPKALFTIITFTAFCCCCFFLWGFVSPILILLLFLKGAGESSECC